MMSEKSKEVRESDEVERNLEIRDFGLELNRGFLRIAIFSFAIEEGAADFCAIELIFLGF
ncbi:hypothetical protein BVRB_6g143520 [Beta vulgaris subsp. vulgaris]|nr:hypothetical protein BVRB_6g143520 [Beta vulgaris subsp. vulgaris]